MNVSAKNIVLVVVAALVSGWTAYVSNFHPGVSTLSVGSFIVSVLNMLVQSPLVAGQSATPPVAMGAAPKPVLNPTTDGLPRAPTWVKDNRHGFAAFEVVGPMGAMMLFMAFMACTAAQFQNFVDAATKLSQPSVALLACALPAAETAIANGGGLNNDAVAIAKIVECAASFGLVITQAEAAATLTVVKPQVTLKLAKASAK